MKKLKIFISIYVILGAFFAVAISEHIHTLQEVAVAFIIGPLLMFGYIIAIFADLVKSVLL